MQPTAQQHELMKIQALNSINSTLQKILGELAEIRVAQEKIAAAAKSK
jgi:hypothetical protein